MRKNESRLDRVLRVAFWAALLGVTFVAGGILSTAQLPPGAQVANAYHSGVALYRQATRYADVYAGDLWYTERRPDRGVALHRPELAQRGLTLYTSAHEATAWLIDMNGDVVHRWHRPFSTVWDKSWAVSRPRKDEHVHFRKARLYPNGDLLVVYEASGDTPYGYGLAKLDKNSNVIWTYRGRAHHDVDIGPDGRIYVLTQQIRRKPVGPFGHLRTPYLDDNLVVLSPDGEEEVRVPLLQAFADSPFRQLVFTVAGPALADPLHANNVDVITADQARNLPFAEPGQVLLSFRELGALAVLDVERKALTWAMRGYWIAQHDPDILDDGRMLLFDNLGNYRGETGRSRILEFDPTTGEIVWSYRGSADRPLDSIARSAQQRLTNGNTLITESHGGRILEVTPDGELAWEFVNPVRGGPKGDMIPVICWGERIVPERDLEPDFARTLAAEKRKSEPARVAHTGR